MNKKITFTISDQFISFERSADPGNSDDYAICAGPVADAQMETFILLTKEEIVEILQAAIELVKGA